MISNIEIDGFRSLIRFQATMKAGLNVLVGPNGSGKTNFVSALDFMSDLLDQDLNRAIANSGGVNSCFSKENRNKSKVPTITISISGQFSGDHDYPYGKSKESDFPKSFEIEWKIRYDTRLPVVYILSEKVRLKYEIHNDLKINRKTKLNENEFVNSINIYPKSHPCKDFIARFYRFSDNENDTIEEAMQKRIQHDHTCLNTIFRSLPGCAELYWAITSFQSVNIDPSAAKSPVPVSNDAAIKKDGHGISQILYLLRDGKYYHHRIGFLMRDDKKSEQKRKFQLIQNWCQEVDHHIHGIDVEIDHDTGQFNPYLIYDFVDTQEKLPFIAISDGTAKWIALTTIVFASEQYSIVEEPENFLHPRMQEIFIQILRESIKQKSTGKQYVITTHSQSMIDNCDVDDLIIFQNIDGITNSSLVENADELKYALRDSQFSLGYYYSKGAVYGENASDR